MHPIARFIAAIVSVVLLAASLFVGAVVALVMLGLVAVGWLVFAFRMWRLRRDAERGQGPPSGPSSNTTIEGDYRVVRDPREDRD